MEEIIKQIAQIDYVAVSNRQNGEQALQERRAQYEKEMLTYREETLAKAHKKADEIYNKIVLKGEQGHDLAASDCQKVISNAKNKYLEIEQVLLNEVFDELFGVEG